MIQDPHSSALLNTQWQDWITAQKRKHMAAVIQGSKVAKFLEKSILFNRVLTSEISALPRYEFLDT